MGLFSRNKDKGSKTGFAINTAKSNGSLDSGNSSVKSPRVTALGTMNRAWDGSTAPNTPLTPFSPIPIPKIDLPRPPDPQLDPAGYLRSLGSVRERSKIITEKAYRNQLRHFDVDMERFPDVVKFVANIIKVSLVPGVGRNKD
jgi:Protein of unknown function (DUF1688)